MIKSFETPDLARDALIQGQVDYVFDDGISLIFWLIIKTVMGLRVSEEEEYQGMDLVDCGMEAYPEFTQGKG